VGCLAKIYAQDTSQGACVLYETMTEPDYAWSHESDKAPMIYALRKQGIKGNFFDWMKADDERREVRISLRYIRVVWVVEITDGHIELSQGDDWSWRPYGVAFRPPP
jgi:hypothetical protein